MNCRDMNWIQVFVYVTLNLTFFIAGWMVGFNACYRQNCSGRKLRKG